MKLHEQRWEGRPSRLWGHLLSGLFVLAGVALATPAQAQLLPYDVSRTPITYQALPITGGGPVTPVPISGDYALTNLSLPFSFQFFGQSYSSIAVTVNGWASINAPYDSHSNWSGFPSTVEPNGLFAVWWADMYCNSGQVKSQVLGTAPNRTMVIEWNCQWWTLSSPTLSAQLWLGEDSSTIEMHYGTSTDTSTTATVGIESPDGSVGYAGLPCAASCSPSLFPTNSAIIYSQAADLTVESLTVDPVLYSGVPFPAHATVRNRGGQDANGFGMDFWLSTDPVLSADDVLIGTAPGTQDAPARSASLSFDAVLTIPPATYEGNYYVLARVDPAGVVFETNKNNNLGVAFAAVSPPKADLTVASIEVPTDPQIGRVIDFTWTARNMGNLLAPEVGYTIVVSRNDVITSTDDEVGFGTISIPAFTDLQRTERITIPAEFSEGPYYVGVILDPLQQLVEIDDMNNVASSADPVWLVSSDLLIANDPHLPPGNAGSTYCVALAARGGTGIYAWTIDSGTLPTGVQMVTEGTEGNAATLLCGVPTEKGTFPFRATVMSGALSASLDFTLEILDGFTPLVIANSDLPAASFQVPYSVALQATGGVAPYEWRMVSGALPQGLSLTRGGVIEGTPLVDGTFDFTVEVKDAANRVFPRDFQLVVASPAALTCMSHSLPAMMVGDDMNVTLNAGGGAGSYRWKSVSWVRLAAGNDDGDSGGEGSDSTAAAPPGFAIDASGVVSGTARKVGSYQWQVEVADAVNASDRCVLTFEITSENGPSIETLQLADALLGVPYSTRLVASGGEGAIKWSLVPGSHLPDGFTLDASTGEIAGIATEGLLEGADLRTFAFAVEARDAASVAATQGLSITVRRAARVPPPVKDGGKDDGGGCQSGDGAPALATLGIAVAALLRRRRD